MHAAGQHRRELEQVLGDAGVVEEVAGEDEERHREQREVLRLGDGELDRDGRRQLGVLQEEEHPEMPIANATGIPMRSSTVKAMRISKALDHVHRLLLMGAAAQLVPDLERGRDQQQNRADRQLVVTHE